MATAGQRLRVEMRRSEIGGTERQRQNLRGLGLRKIGDVRELADTAAVRGMIRRVEHLVRVDRLES